MPDAPELELPEDYRRRLPRSWQPWLEQLAPLVTSCLERWELTIVGEFPLSYCYVVPVQRADGRPCVLKIQPTGIPEVGSVERELLGLRLAAPVTVGVIDDDAKNGVLLLDRALPGSSLDEMAEWDDDAATQTLALVIRDYGRAVDDPNSAGLRPFEEFADAFERFDRGPHGMLPRSKTYAGAKGRLSDTLGMDEPGSELEGIRTARDIAERVLADLLVDHSQPSLLHGDLHHGNVLRDEQRGLLVIDPWGLCGDRSADVAPALHNPIQFVAQATDVDTLTRRRLDIYSEVLDLDKETLTAWCFVYNVIRALWILEDGCEFSDRDAGVRTVRALRKLI